MSDKQVKHALQGHVKHQGLPVSGVEVQVHSPFAYGSAGVGRGEPPIATVNTGSKGEFAFNLPTGSYSLEVIPRNGSRFLKERLAMLELKSSTTCNLSLNTGFILSGSVQTQSGDRLRDCEVVALGIEPSSYAAVSPVEPDGSYALVLPKGKFHVASRYQKQEGQDEDVADEGDSTDSFPFVSTQVSVVNLVVDGSLDLLLPDLIRFQGEVRDVFGQPVKGSTVRIYPNAANSEQIVVKELALSAECVSDAEGRFEIRVEPGSFDIEILPAPMSTHFGLKEQNVKIHSDSFRKFTLEEGHKLRGEVLFEESALPNCLVRLQDVRGSKEFIAKTDADGQFTMGVPGGNYKMVVVAHPKNAPTVTIDGAEHTGIAPWAKMIVVGGDTHVSAILRSGTALRGRVKDDSGQARSGMQVSVFADLGDKLSDDMETGLPLAHAVTDAEGRYSIFLSPGEYLLVVHKDFDNATPVEVEDEPVNLDITWHGWCQLKFEIGGEDGARVPRCQVEYHPYGEKTEDEKSSGNEEEPDETSHLPRGYVLTDDDGRCQVTIPQGVYTFRFNPPSSGSYEAKHIRQLSISADMTRKVVLGLKKSV